jgi:hypothetical protein
MLGMLGTSLLLIGIAPIEEHKRSLSPIMVAILAIVTFLVGVSSASLVIVVMLANGRNERYWSFVSRHALIGRGDKACPCHTNSLLLRGRSLLGGRRRVAVDLAPQLLRASRAAR